MQKVWFERIYINMTAESIAVHTYLYMLGFLCAIFCIVCYFWTKIDYHCFQRIFAWNITREVPYLNELLLKEKKQTFLVLHKYKKQINKNLTVLDVGSGPAANLAFFPENTKLVCLDPNPHYKGYIKESLKKYDNVVSLDICQGYAEKMSFESEAFDVVCCSFVLCTVQDIGKSLEEIYRVLKPGGKMVFLEHISATDKRSWTYALQFAMIPLARLIFGCHVTRDTAKFIKTTGFCDLQLQYVQPKQAPLWLNTCIIGVATK